MRFQYASDLHIEFRTEPPSITRCAPNLILTGDIGNPREGSYRAFLSEASATFDDIFLIAGNHEFYGSSLSATRAAIREICSAFHNVHYLDNSVASLPSLPVHIFGGTMWSDVADDERPYVEAAISDYRRILGFGVETARNEHAVFVDLLSAALDEHSDKPFVVISHHLPLKRLVAPEHASSMINSAFASDVRLADDPRISAWVYGHTHTPRLGPRYFCNSFGYPGENDAATLDEYFDLE